MSSSSSSEAGEYSDHDFSVQGDTHIDDKDFDGWDDNPITFETDTNNKDADEQTGSNTTKSVQIDESWPSFDEPVAVVMKRSVPVGQNEEEEEDEEIYEGSLQAEDIEEEEEGGGEDDENEQQEETPAQKKIREEMEARQAEAEAAEKKRRLEEAKRALDKSKADSEREKREAVEAEKKRREEEEKVRKAFRDQQEALKKAEKERKEADEAAAAKKTPQPSPMKQQPPAPAKHTEVQPIPKETIPDLNRRARETAAMEDEPQQQTQQKVTSVSSTAKELDDALAKHSNDNNQFQKAVRDPKILDRLRAALDEFHQYAKTPIAERSYTFQNEFFNASSKSITNDVRMRLQEIVEAAKKLTVGEKDEDRLFYEVSPYSTAVEPLLKQLSHALCAYITSQEKVDPQQRRGVAGALIADVIVKADPENVARTTQILACTIADLLCSEAAALKIAELVSEGEKKKLFRKLRVLILNDVTAFINSINASTATAEKIMQQISVVSSSFEEIANNFTAIKTEGSQKPSTNKRMSHGMVLSILLRQYVLYNPAVRNFFTDNEDARASLVYQSNVIVPDLIMYPEAMYDVLAGMLDTIRASFNVISKTEDRTRVMLVWNQIKKELTSQVGYLSQSEQAPKAETKAVKATTKASEVNAQTNKSVAFDTKKQSATTPVASSIKQAPEERFLRRFEMEDSDSE